MVKYYNRINLQISSVRIESIYDGHVLEPSQYLMVKC